MKKNEKRENQKEREKEREKARDNNNNNLESSLRAKSYPHRTTQDSKDFSFKSFLDTFKSLSSSSEAGLHRSTESDTECQRQNDCL